MNKKNIVFVVQRYGIEVNGGSEVYCRTIAERLTQIYDVEVITTCAIDYVTWENKYVAGIEEINGVRVRRFPVKKPRNQKKFDEYTQQVLNCKNRTIEEEENWIKMQGPDCPEAIKYIEENSHKYTKIIFMTYLYYLTAIGLPRVSEKAIMIPTAHDEPWIYFDIYNKIFNSPSSILYLTEEEKQFVNNRFKNSDIPSDIVGMGIETPSNVKEQGFKDKYNMRNYIIYVGRIDESKGCKELFEYFIKYKSAYNDDLKLVLMGKASMEIPQHKDIVSLGFVSEEDKYNGIKGSKVLVLPSYYESLSISVLESLALQVPVIVNGSCEVLKGHCIKSNAGLYYKNKEEFIGCLEYLMNNSTIRKKMGINGEKYIKENYAWPKVIEKYINSIEL